MEPAQKLPESVPRGETQPEPTGKLPLGIKLAYGMPGFAGAAMAVPIAIHMTKFYSDTIGVALGYIALAQALARAFDAITDPIMGWISDRTRTRWGRRRPWILVGTPLCALAFVALFAPPEGMGRLAAAAWFTATFTLYFLFHTIYGIPHYGLGAELTLDYHERSSLFAWRDGFILLGTLTAGVLPFKIVQSLKQGGMDAGAAERDVYLWFAVVMSVLMVLLFFRLCWRVPENPAFYQRKPNPLVPGVRRVLRNRPFRILLSCYLISAITGAIPGIFLPFYIQYVLGLENWSGWVGNLLLVYFGSGFACLPGWLWLARRFGKKRTWLSNYVLGMTASLSLFFLPVVFPGESAIVPMIVILTWAGAAFGAGMFLGPSIQADVIDYDELYTARRREAQYGSLWAIAAKFAFIPGASIPLAILASSGFQPNVVQTDSVVWTLRAIYGLAPATFSLLALCVAVRFPITEPVHRAILAGIRAHQRGESAEDPLTGKLLAPPSSRGIDEETGWFLDHFSPGELRRSLHGNRRRLARDTLTALGLSLLVCVAASTHVLLSVGDLGTRPGLTTVLAVMLAGVGLTGVLFHLVRVRATLRMVDIRPEEVRGHLALVERLAQRG